MFHFQSHLIFPTHAVAPAGPFPKRAKRLSVRSGDGDELSGIHIPPDDAVAERTLVLGFGGNAWNGQDVAEYLHELYPEADVVVFHYRGYQPSRGSPSAQGLLADAPLVFDTAVEHVKPKRTVAVGFSIGCGIASHLATQRKLDGLILVTPFDSLKAVAQSMFPWIPLGPFFTHEIDASAAIRTVDVPVAIIGAERDEIVPSERTDALRKVVPNLVFDRTLPRCGHNDIYTRSDFQAAMREALCALAG